MLATWRVDRSSVGKACPAGVVPSSVCAVFRSCRLEAAPAAGRGEPAGRDLPIRKARAHSPGLLSLSILMLLLAPIRSGTAPRAPSEPDLRWRISPPLDRIPPLDSRSAFRSRDIGLVGRASGGVETRVPPGTPW